MRSQLIRSVGAVGGMTLLSRVTGLVRDIAFAQYLGSGALADAFFVAFRIPNFFGAYLVRAPFRSLLSRSFQNTRHVTLQGRRALF